MIFRFVFTITLLLSCLFLVELFFQLNKYLNIFEAKTFDYSKAYNQTIFETPRAPDHIVDEITTKYKNFKPDNYEKARSLFNNQKTKLRSSSPYVPQKFIGMVNLKFKAPFKITDKSVNTKYNVTLFDSTYEFDAHRRRIVKNQKINANFKNIVLIGCSLTFGVGVNQGEDLASNLHQRMPKYNIYNLGIPGAGMNQMLQDLQSYKRLEDLNNRGGVVIYSMIYPHLERTFCSMACHNETQNWMALQNKNMYDINESGELVSLGSYKKYNKTQYWLREILAKSATLQFIGYDSPKVYDDFYINKYIQYLKYLQNFYKSKNLDFYLYIPIQNKFFDKSFLAQLETNSIKSFSYDQSQVLKSFAGRLNIPGDGHFSKMGNDFQAALISNYLKSQGY